MIATRVKPTMKLGNKVEYESNNELVAVCVRAAFVRHGRPVTTTDVIEMVNGRASRATVYRHMLDLRKRGDILYYGQLSVPGQGRGRKPVTYIPAGTEKLPPYARGVWRRWCTYMLLD